MAQQGAVRRSIGVSRFGSGWVRVLLLVALLAGCGGALRGQTLDDGIMLGRLQFCTGVFYSNDRWESYWEGAASRVNGNLGTVTTQTLEWTGNFAVTNKLDLLVTTPYVWTKASGGVLHGQRGFQDVSLGAKYKLVSIPVKNYGALRAIVVLSGNLPMTNYTPDLQPLSLGTQSRRIAGRGTINYLGKRGVYLNATSQYTFRANVTLDRSSYFTNNQLYLSDRVALPNQFEYGFAGGYRRNDTTLTVNFTQQQTRGGGDIRIQDTPFVSNRVNFSKIGGTLTYPIPRFRDLQLWLIYSNTFAGRNVGQANTFTTGFLYTFKFEKGGMQP